MKYTFIDFKESTSTLIRSLFSTKYVHLRSEDSHNDKLNLSICILGKVSVFKNSRKTLFIPSTNELHWEVPSDMNQIPILRANQIHHPSNFEWRHMSSFTHIQKSQNNNTEIKTHEFVIIKWSSHFCNTYIFDAS